MAYDLDKALAEDAKEPFEFTFDGETYVLPNDLDLRVVDLLSAGALAPAFEELLGPDQWQRLVDSPKVFGSIAATQLADAYLEHLGLSSGESRASSSSFASTARPSKPTSSGSTVSRSGSSERLR